MRLEIIQTKEPFGSRLLVGELSQKSLLLWKKNEYIPVYLLLTTWWWLYLSEAENKEEVSVISDVRGVAYASADRWRAAESSGATIVVHEATYTRRTETTLQLWRTAGAQGVRHDALSGVQLMKRLDSRVIFLLHHAGFLKRAKCTTSTNIFSAAASSISAFQKAIVLETRNSWQRRVYTSRKLLTRKIYS